MLPERWSLRPSDPALRPFLPGLRFAFFNALTWQVVIGTPLILLIEALGGSSAQAGMAYSFIFLLTPVQFWTAVLLPRIGYKRLTLQGWTWRAVMICVPLLITAWVPLAGERGWMLPALIASVFIFCLLRAVGAAASSPWFVSMVPSGSRGAYFASDQLMGGLGSLVTLVACVALFTWLPTFPALFAQYAVAMLGSVLAVKALRELPDVPAPQVVPLRELGRDFLRLATSGGAFTAYFWMTTVFFIATTPLLPFMAYHLRSDLGLDQGWIMGFEWLRYVGAVVAAVSLRRTVDAVGAKVAIFGSLLAFGTMAIVWGSGTASRSVVLLGVSYLVMGAANTGFVVANLALLPKLLSERDRMIGITLHGAVSSLAGGAATITWGWVLRAEGGAVGLSPFSFQCLFWTALACCAGLLAGMGRIQEPNTKVPPELMLSSILLRPHRALASLIRIPAREDQDSRR